MRVVICAFMLFASAFAQDFVHLDSKKILNEHSAKLNSILLRAVVFSEASMHAQSATFFTQAYEMKKDLNLTYYIAIEHAKAGSKDLAFKFAKIYERSKFFKNEIEILGILADGYVKQRAYKKAIPYAQRIIKSRGHNLNDFLTMSFLYTQSGLFTDAMRLYMDYFESTKDISVRFEVKRLLASLKSKKTRVESMQILKSALERCKDVEVCDGLLLMMQDANAGNTSLKVALQRYKSNQNMINTHVLSRVYGLNGKPSLALKVINSIKISKSFKLVDKMKMLLNYYVDINDLTNASKVAGDIYGQTKDPFYLAWSGYYEYGATLAVQENLKGQHLESSNLASALEKLNRAAEGIRKLESSKKSAFFYNFLGFILIDKNIDVKRGVAFVKDALDIDPYSIAYIDSLAWGYYKQKLCALAQSTFKNIPQDQIIPLGLANHSELISKCK